MQLTASHVGLPYACACACECFDSKVNNLKRYLNFPPN